MKKKKLIASIAAPIAIAGLMFSMTSVSTSFAEETEATAPAAPAGVGGGTGSTVGTKPQCSWSLTGVATTNTLAAADEAKYSGTELTITGTDSDIAASVGGVDCSWYNFIKGAEISVSTGAGPKFSITDDTDTSMNFNLTTENPLTLATTATCEDWVKNPSATIGGTVVEAKPLSLAKVEVTTTSSCTYAMTLTAKVPAGKAPKDAGTDYALVGPSLTTTLTLKD
jgi:uncharacterized protein YodC (DUF2158 family)